MWSSVPRTHIRWLTATCNPSPRGSSALFWTSWALPSQVCTHFHTQLKINLLKIQFPSFLQKKKFLGPAATQQNHSTVKCGRLPGNQLKLQIATSALTGSTSSLPPEPWPSPEKTYSNEEKRRRDFRNYVGWTRGSSVLTWRVSGPRFSPQSWKKETRKALKGASRAMVRKGTNHIQIVCVLHGLYIQTILMWNRNLLHFYKLEQNQSVTRQTKLFVIPPRNKPSKKKCKTSALKIRVITKRNWGRPKYRIQESRPVSVDWKPC